MPGELLRVRRGPVPDRVLSSSTTNTLARSLRLGSRPMTATELSNDCEMSLSTVYRRLDALEDCGLVAARTHIADDGHHVDVTRHRWTHSPVSHRRDFEVSVAVESKNTSRRRAGSPLGVPLMEFAGLCKLLEFSLNRPLNPQKPF